jgi:anoctamin-8
MQPFNYVADYYGERFGFYFSWLVHYTSMLLLPALVGLGIFLAQCVSFLHDYRDHQKFHKDDKMGISTFVSKHFGNYLNSYYGIFIAIWCTLAVESWKRKQNKLANVWLIRDFTDSTSERSEFKATYDIDSSTKKVWKRSYTSSFLRALLIGIPITIIFMGAVLLCVIYTRLWYENYYKDKKTIPYLASFIPSMANSVYILVFTKLYEPVAMKLVNFENHKSEDDHENSLIGKMIMFQFVNAYIANFIYAFWFRSFYDLAKNLASIVIFMNILNNILEYVKDRTLVDRKV